MSRARILVVEDEASLRTLYSEILTPDYDVVSAANGETALQQFDHSIDVVVLDRRMPEMEGDEVLDRIRTDGYDCPVVMVSAVDPAVDIIGMRFNEYLVKPITGPELHATVEQMLALSTANVQAQEYFALAAKQAALETELSKYELENTPEYQELLDRIDALRDRAGDAISEFESSL